MGKIERKKYLKKIIGTNSRFDIKLFDQKYLKNNNFNYKGIIIDDDDVVKKKNMQFLFDLNNKGIKFMKISYWFERYLNRYPSELVKSSEIINGEFLYDELSLRARIKRTGESILSLIILILSFPILFLSAFLIKLEDGGPVFYSQIRNGFEGKQFRIYKLRTMIINAEKDGIQWAKKSDQIITKIGKILRKLRIDELPQLWNVLKGNMSLVGPRPALFSQEKLRDARKKHDVYRVRPGITGLSQVSGLDTSTPELLAETDAKMIENLSLIDYFKYIIATAGGKGGGDAAER